MFSNIVFGNNEENSLLKSCHFGEFEKARNELKFITNPKLKAQLETYINIVQFGDFKDINLEQIALDTMDNSTRAILKINKALKYYLQEGNETKAYQLLKESLNISESSKNKTLICLSSRLILELYSRSLFTINDISYQYIIDNYLKYANEDFDKKSAYLYDFKITMRYFYKDSAQVLAKKYKKVNALYANDSLNYNTAKLYLSNSGYHNRITKNIDSSFYYIYKAKAFFSKNQGYFTTEKHIATKINLASLLFIQKKYKQSLNVLNEITFNSDDYIFKILNSYVNLYKFQNYKALGDDINALTYQNKALTQQLLQNQTKNLQVVSEYETKYETEKKQRKNVELTAQIETEKREKRNLWLGSAMLLMFGITTAYLTHKNTKKKQLIAEKEKELETQKLATILKEQELTTIDAMIEGQEKERQRIANDLHDDLGGLMATVKLHFNALKDKQTPELYNKTNELIDEAYHKIRTVAHAKNSGLIAKQGLLKAVHEMADKISVSNKITIDIIDHGLENRLENSLELTLFRIIQELITNVIKHANATEVTLHITNHVDSLNLMVEDNGKGFNPSQITIKSRGMGISSIDKRVEHLNGTMTIESATNQGTTIIIDIPI
nr:sensor histidine kinase [uncultured Psychroserpens sp.]